MEVRVKLNSDGSHLRIVDVTVEGDAETLRQAGRLLGDVMAGTVGQHHGELANRRAGERLARDVAMLDETAIPAINAKIRA